MREERKRMDYRVLLFYKYISFPEPEKFVQDHLQFCQNHDIKGRVWISSEGINATVSGTVENIEAFKNEIRSYPQFSDIWFKEDENSGHAFRKIHVRLKREIVNASFGEVDLSKTGKYLAPEKLNEFYESGKEFLIIDARNEYESVIGKFKNAVAPKMETFRDWVKVADEIHYQKFLQFNFELTKSDNLFFVNIPITAILKISELPFLIDISFIVALFNPP